MLSQEKVRDSTKYLMRALKAAEKRVFHLLQQTEKKIVNVTKY